MLLGAWVLMALRGLDHLSLIHITSILAIWSSHLRLGRMIARMVTQYVVWLLATTFPNGVN